MRAAALLALVLFLAGCSGGEGKTSAEEGNKILKDRQTGARPASGVSRRSGKE